MFQPTDAEGKIPNDCHYEIVRNRHSVDLLPEDIFQVIIIQSAEESGGSPSVVSTCYIRATFWLFESIPVEVLIVGFPG